MKAAWHQWRNIGNESCCTPANERNSESQRSANGNNERNVINQCESVSASKINGEEK